MLKLTIFNYFLALDKFNTKKKLLGVQVTLKILDRKVGRKFMINNKNKVKGMLNKTLPEIIINKARKGIHSIWWKPEMLVGADKSKSGIPYCPTTATEISKDLITYTEAKQIYKEEQRKGNKAFVRDVFVCFYEDDYKFDSTCGIWFRNKQAYKILKHFAGIITPDFSTYYDFPDPLKRWNTYRMRAFGYWYGKLCGKQVINNVRGDLVDSWEYCFDGISQNSILAIGTVASDVKKLYYRSTFETWLDEMVFILKPKVILVYGSSNYACFDRLREKGIRIVTYQSKTARFYAGGESNE